MRAAAVRWVGECVCVCGGGGVQRMCHIACVTVHFAMVLVMGCVGWAIYEGDGTSTHTHPPHSSCYHQ
jgi:hypothetical protein